ncbi:MAG TPA: hypothetical protein VMP01_23395 [Pirellulaceae bacterium]|nr:hypothetical protein [Pirellulaceae bacterium]
MSKPRSAGLVLLAAVTIFVSAFLLFQVQPLISKKILPWFGGSPAVWTTCMLFFQALLLGGYTYAHLLTKYVSPLWQGRIHAGLLVLAVLTLPIIPSDWWKPDDGTMPSGRILLLLLAKVGAPYFLLSTTGPLIQAWFALANPGKSPYRLYALSNVGSLGALLTYPFIFEYYLTVDWQGWLWSGAFILFALLAGAMGLWIWRIAAGLVREGIDASKLPPKSDLASGDGAPRWHHQIGWLLLAALPSMTFLAITNHLCQDVAPVPLLFIVPLSLYLLTLIICFDREAWYSRIFFGLFGGLVIALLCGLENASSLDQAMLKYQDKVTFTGAVNAVLSVPQEIGFFLNRRFETNHDWSIPLDADDYEDDVYFQAVMYLTALFFGCMLCHGELVQLKPAPKHLTQYYLLISAGGALGGLFVALISPSLFVRAYELPLSIVGCFAVAMLALFYSGQRWKFTRQEMVQWSAAFACVGCLILIGASQLNFQEKDDVEIITRRRNFYGAIAVHRKVDLDGDGNELPETEGRALYHGRILHGFQYTSDSRIDQITTYYGVNSGPGLAVRHHPARVAGKPLSVGVVGLGTGTMAGFANAGDYFCFYDIDPKIMALHDEGIFQFVQRARQRGAEVPIEIGDARITMEREADAKSKQYDIIVLDAFSGDAIPAHLLTLESVKVYDELLRRDDNGNSTGILAIHISNRYLNLAPVVTALAKEYGFDEVPVDDDGGGDDAWETSSNWVLLTRNQEFLDDVVIKATIAQNSPTPSWHVLQPASFASAGGASGKIQHDGAILVGGNRPANDTYTIRFSTKLADIAGIKIEALTDKSLPGEGPGRGQKEEGSFVLQEVELSVEESGAKPLLVTLTEPSADLSAPGYDVAGAIDDDENTGWSIGSETGQDHLVSFTLAEPISDPAQRTLVLRLEQNAGGAQTLGKFRVSVLAVEKELPVLWTDQYSNLLNILK